MKKLLWWHTGIIYQIYPRSFQDSNSDGIGDLQGIIGRLDYLKAFGVEVLWLSPIYPSPMADFGYDISDYCNIDPLFGSLQDFDQLAAAVHQRGMKLVLDLVPNHTSDQHSWFLESRSSRDNPKRDWYLWQDPASDGGLPNNWLSVFGGSGWEWDEKTGQYYYHGFLKEQPDLNWRNPEVRQAMLDVMRFWLDKGVDGFRVDVMWHMIKDLQLRDNPINDQYQPFMPTYDRLLPVYSTEQPEVHEIVRQMRAVLDEYKDRMMIGEIYLPLNQLMAYYGKAGDEVHLPFNFQLLSLPWDAGVIAAAVEAYEAALPFEGWPNWVLGNHDRPRITSRVGSGQARVAAMLLLTLRGTPTIYYGDEIGMRDVPIPFDEILDPQGLNMPDKNLSRDPCRTPMQWDSTNGAGFTLSTPWLRLDKSFPRQNVELQRNDPYSMFSLYKRLITLRQKEVSLHAGEYQPVFSDSQMLVFIRQAAGEARFLIVLNLKHGPCYFRAQQFGFAGTIELATDPELDGMPIKNEINLSGDEGVIIRLE
jgi:alpha-glucosidase